VVNNKQMRLTPGAAPSDRLTHTAAKMKSTRNFIFAQRRG